MAQLVGHRPDVASAFEGLGALAFDQKDYALAEQYYQQSLAIWEEIGHEPEIGFILCRISAAQVAKRPPDYDQIQAQLIKALRLAKKHQAGTVALTALAGLETLRVLSGEVDQPQDRLYYAIHHPATTLEVRRWIESFLSQAGFENLSPSNTAESFATTSWQNMAEWWDNPSA